MTTAVERTLEISEDLSATQYGRPSREEVVQPSLIVVHSPATDCVGTIIPLEATLSIGRSIEASIPIKDPELSRLHVEIVQQQDTYIIRDLGSRNGTRVNGVEVDEVPLRSGDQIQIGATLLQFLGSMVGNDAWARTLASSSVALWEYFHDDGEIVFAGDVDRALDLPAGTLASRRWSRDSVVHPDDRERFRTALCDERPELELRLQPAPTLVRWVILRGRQSDPSHGYVGGTIVDITAVKRQQATVARTALVFENVLDGVALTDHDGVLVDMNPAMAKIFHVPRQTAIGKSLFSVVLVSEPDRLLRDARTEIAQAERWTATLQTSSATFEVLAFPLRTDQGESAGIAWMFRDVSERLRMQEQIAFLDRLAALGTLSAGLAHEVNNPLTFILGNAEVLGEALGDRESLREAVGEIKEGARRIAAIVRDLRLFSRADADVTARAVDVTGALEAAMKLTGSAVRGRCELVPPTERLLPALAVESRLVQVFVNVLLNAAQSLPAAPSPTAIVVRTTNERDGVVVEIEDHGAGMAPEVAARAFEPFFTTKPHTGMGLGLSICHGLVVGMGGTIELASAPGRGTTVRIWLPGAIVPMAGPRAPEPRAESCDRLRVLVVDDEPVVLRTVGRLLREHDVVTANGFGAAMQHLIERREHFDVVLCDLMMPDGTGMDLHERLVLHRPEVLPHLVFVTGGAFTQRAQDFLDTTANPYLLKPVDGDSLRAAVRQAHSMKAS